MSDDTVTLTVGAVTYSGWERIAVTRSMETFCGGFELQVTERWPGAQAAMAIQPGQRCALSIGDDRVITGYVDDVDPVYDAEQHYVAVRGRDAAGDLVDCSVQAGVVNIPPGPALQMIRTICAPFQIDVTADVSQAQTVVYNFAVQLVETAFEAISRIAEQAGFLVVSNGRGGLLLTNAGSAGGAAPVALGKNILRAKGFNSMKGRFSAYVVGAQMVASDTEDVTAATIAQGKASDPNVPRFRPLLMMTDIGYNGLDYLTARAQWEATVRIGRSFRPMVTVRGWRDDAGALWQPNTTVQVKDEWLGIDGALLIAGVRYLMDNDEGTRTELSLTLPQAFTVAPIPLYPNLQNVGGTL